MDIIPHQLMWYYICEKFDKIQQNKTKLYTNVKKNGIISTKEDEIKMEQLLKYLIEIAIYIIAITTCFIIFKVKKKKGMLKIFAISFAVFIIVIGVEIFLEKPRIEYKDAQIEIEACTNETITKPNVKYLFKDVTNNLKVIENIDYNKIGEYEVTYQIKTLHGLYEEKQVVKIVDHKPPEITLQDEEDIKLSYTKEYEEPGVTATDECDGDLTQNIQAIKEEISENEYNLKYEVSDSSGNKATKTRHVTIIDDVPPVIRINGKASMVVSVNSSYSDAGAKAEDEIEGDLSSQIKVEGTVDTSKEGTYTITYIVSDSKGNESRKTRMVTVQVPRPQIQAQTGTDGQPGVIYLTFDDGPSSSITPKVLDILKQKNVKATFFIINYGNEGEQFIKREVAEGHTVAIHGYSHDYGTIYQSEEAFMNNVTKLREKIKQSTGQDTTIIRFPGGSSNTVSKKYCPGIMTSLCHKVLEQGYRYFDWNVSSQDAGGAKNSNEVYKNVTRGLKKDRANVVLMHDFSGNTKTLNALSDIIDFGIQNGYTFARITENTPMVTHTPNN